MKQHMKEVTDLDLVRLVQAAFKMSEPKGKGWLNYDPLQKLSDEEALKMLNLEGINQDKELVEVLKMDCVHGRKCNFILWGKGGKVFTQVTWPGHTLNEFSQILFYASKHFPKGKDHVLQKH